MNKKLKNIIIILIVIILIYVIYSVGIVRGVILGTYYSETRHNSTVCDMLNMTRDNEGFCILSNDAKYDDIIECGYEKFRVIGEKEIPDWVKIVSIPRRIIYYPLIHCKIY